jgi:hypothetical protein
VTLPNVRWALLYGVILCNARAMGEFGAVSVVSGHIRGQTNTLPLHIEIVYNEYQFAAAFAVASLLAGLALVTLGAKYVGGARVAREKRSALQEALSMSIAVRNLNKRFGTPRSPATTSTWTSRLASWWRCWGRRAAARPRCCASSPAWKCPTAATCCSTARTPPTPTCASARWASCSSTTRCSAT